MAPISTVRVEAVSESAKMSDDSAKVSTNKSDISVTFPCFMDVFENESENDGNDKDKDIANDDNEINNNETDNDNETDNGNELNDDEIDNNNKINNDNDDVGSAAESAAKSDAESCFITDDESNSGLYLLDVEPNNGNSVSNGGKDANSVSGGEGDALGTGHPIVSHHFSDAKVVSVVPGFIDDADVVVDSHLGSGVGGPERNVWEDMIAKAETSIRDATADVLAEHMTMLDQKKTSLGEELETIAWEANDENVKIFARERKSVIQMVSDSKEQVLETIGDYTECFKNELLGELKLEMREEIKSEMMADLKSELKAELKSALTSEIKAEVKKELYKDLKEEWEMDLKGFMSSFADVMDYQAAELKSRHEAKFLKMQKDFEKQFGSILDDARIGNFNMREYFQSELAIDCADARRKLYLDMKKDGQYVVDDVCKNFPQGLHSTIIQISD